MLGSRTEAGGKPGYDHDPKTQLFQMMPATQINNQKRKHIIMEGFVICENLLFLVVLPLGCRKHHELLLPLSQFSIHPREETWQPKP